MLETSQGIVEKEKRLRTVMMDSYVVSGPVHQLIQGNHTSVAATFPAPPGLRIIDEHVAHGPGSRGEKVSSILPIMRLTLRDELDVRLMHERRRVEGMIALPVLPLPPREPPQLVIDKSEKLVERGIVPVLHLHEKPRHRIL
jgi:hypothetical protein